MTAPSATAAATPFPFASLEALTRADVAAAARLRRVARQHVDLPAVARALEELLGDRVELLVRRYRPLDATRGADDAIGVVFATSGERAPTERVLVEVEGALGAALATRALKQRAPRIIDPSRAPAPATIGAVAAVLHAALRRAHAGVASKVVAAGPATALAADLARSERAVTTAWLTVLLGPDAFEARVSVPDGATVRPRPVPLSRGDLLAMGDAVLALPLVVASPLASRADLRELAAGDAFVFGKPPLTLGVGSSAPDTPEVVGALLGPVALVPARGERGISADLAEGGRLVVRGLLESHPWEREMSSDPSATTTTEILEDAAVVVRVELGTVELKAREWADLGPGDVVSLGRKVGDHAILRVGGVELGRGELVVVDGEYAVRILARATSATGTGTGTGESR